MKVILHSKNGNHAIKQISIPDCAPTPRVIFDDNRCYVLSDSLNTYIYESQPYLVTETKLFDDNGEQISSVREEPSLVISF